MGSEDPIWVVGRELSNTNLFGGFKLDNAPALGAACMIYVCWLHGAAQARSATVPLSSRVTFA